MRIFGIEISKPYKSDVVYNAFGMENPIGTRIQDLSLVQAQRELERLVINLQHGNVPHLPAEDKFRRVLYFPRNFNPR
jgi:hypothetical protein